MKWCVLDEGMARLAQWALVWGGGEGRREEQQVAVSGERNGRGGLLAAPNANGKGFLLIGREC